MGIDFRGKNCYDSQMNKAQEISIALTSEMNALLQEVVASGQYDSASAVVDEALGVWQEMQWHRQLTSEQLRALYEEGMASGPCKELNFEKLKAELNAEYDNKQRLKGVA